MHRDPPHPGAARTPLDAVERARRQAGRPRASAIRGWKPRAWGRWPASPSATTCSPRPTAIGIEAMRVFGDPQRFAPDGADGDTGAFLPPMLYALRRSLDAAEAVHEVEAFGPVSTVMPYRDLAMRSRSPTAAGARLVAVGVHPRRRRRAKSSCWAPAPITAGLLRSTATARKESTGHGSPLAASWSMAALAALAAARRWAASAA